MNINPPEIKKIAQQSKEIIDKAKKLIVLPLPKEPYYQPGPMVRRNSISGMNPFEILVADTLRDHLPERRPTPIIDDDELQRAVQGIQQPTTTPIRIAITEALPTKPKRGRRKTININTPLKPTNPKKKKELSAKYIDSDSTTDDNCSTIKPVGETSTYYHMPAIGDEFQEEPFVFGQGIPRTPLHTVNYDFTNSINLMSEPSPTIDFNPMICQEQNDSYKLSEEEIKYMKKALRLKSSEIKTELKRDSKTTKQVLATAHQIMEVAMDLFDFDDMDDED